MGSGIGEVVPLEVLSFIIGHLFVPEGTGKYRAEMYLGDLRNARLVCRRWNSVAETRLFHQVALVPPQALPDTDPDDCNFKRFKQLTSSPTVQHAARCVEIFSSPDPFERDFDIWEAWEDGHYPAFTSAIDRIVDLPRLREVRIRFTKGCVGDVEDNDYWWESGFEHPSTRFHTLRAVFNAIHNRSTSNAGSNSTIKTLTIQNLQNKILPEDILTSDSFQSTVKNITNLRLQIAHERNEAGPDNDLNLPDRQIFEPWLQTTLLPIFANQITTLHLAFNDYWGVCPGYFDGQNLSFPNLGALTLKRFAIAHHDQFNWVLRQKTLQTLRLDQCVIISHITFEPGQLEAWNTPTHDWTRYPDWAFGIEPRHKIFYFPGTWETVYEKIQEQLTNIVDFRTEHPFRSHGQGPSFFFVPERLGCLLSPRRYTTTWCKDVNPLTGEMTLGNCDPAPFPGDSEQNDPCTTYKRAELNRAKETRDGDLRALKALVDVVVGRRRQKGLDEI